MSESLPTTSSTCSSSSISLLFEDFIPLIYYTRALFSNGKDSSKSEKVLDIHDFIRGQLTRGPSHTVFGARKQLPIYQYVNEIIHNHFLIQELQGLSTSADELEQVISDYLYQKVSKLSALYRDSLDYGKFRCSFIETEEIYTHEPVVDLSSGLYHPSVHSRQLTTNRKGDYFTFNLDDLPAYEPLEETLRLLRHTDVKALPSPLQKLLVYDLNDLLENSQWNELIDLLGHQFASETSTQIPEETALLFYAIGYRWLQGFQKHYQTVELINLLLAHFDQCLTSPQPGNAGSGVGPHPQSVARAQILLVMEIFRLLASLSDFSSESDARLCLLRFFGVVSRGYVATSKGSVPLLTVLLSCPDALTTLERIFRATCLQEWNLLVILVQSGLLEALFRDLLTEKARPGTESTTKAMIAIMVFEPFCRCEFAEEVLGLFYYIAERSPGILKSPPQEISSLKALFLRCLVQEGEKQEDLLSLIFSHRLLPFLGVEDGKTVTHWWISTIISPFVTFLSSASCSSPESDSFGGFSLAESRLVLFDHLMTLLAQKLPNSEIKIASLATPLLERSLEDCLQRMNPAALLAWTKQIRCSHPQTKTSDRLGAKLWQTIIERILESPLIRSWLLEDLEEKKSQVFQEVFDQLVADSIPHPFLTMRLVLELQSLAMETASRSPAGTNELLLTAISYYLQVFFPHRDQIFLSHQYSAAEKVVRAANDCQRLFYAMVYFLLLYFRDSSSSLPVDTALLSTAISNSYRIRLSYFDYFVDQEREKVFQMDLQQLLVLLAPLSGRLQTHSHGRLILESLVDKLCRHPLVSENALQSSHPEEVFPEDGQWLTNHHPHFALFEFLRGLVSGGDDLPLVVVVDYFDGYLEQPERNVEDRLVIGTDYLERLLGIPAFPYFLELLLTYLNRSSLKAKPSGDLSLPKSSGSIVSWDRREIQSFHNDYCDIA